MPKYTVAMPSDDEPEQYNEVVGGKVLADSFKERGGWLRGGWSINGVQMRGFESNSPENLIAQINAKRPETGVFAQMEDGHLKLSHQSAAPILIDQGPGYQPPNKPGETPPAPAENTILADLGLEPTTEENDARAAQLAAGNNGVVGQMGDGQATRMDVRPGSPQSADEIDAQNRRMMSNSNPTWGGYAPHAPHETVPGTTTTGNRPQPVAPDSNERRVELQPGQPGPVGMAPTMPPETEEQRTEREAREAEAAEHQKQAQADEANRQLRAQEEAAEARRKADEQRKQQTPPVDNPPAA